ncbi:MAG: hypothetical protein Q9184_007214 [Pyrenodesmia sp. 2 TL-2023]
MSCQQRTISPDLRQWTNPFNIIVDERSRVADLLDILYPRLAESIVTHVLPGKPSGGVRNIAIFACCFVLISNLLEDQGVLGAFRSGAVAQKVKRTRKQKLLRISIDELLNAEQTLIVMKSWDPLETPSLNDIRPDTGNSDLRNEILVGLNSKPKYLPSMLLWDNQGLARFEALRTTTSIDYYPSRKETEVLKRNIAEIARTIPTGATLVELGSGYVSPVKPTSELRELTSSFSNTEKTALILSALQRQDKSVTYHALDLSPVGLLSSLAVLTETFPQSSRIGCHGLLGSYDDFLAWLAQKPKQLKSPVIILWLGNSIGNLDASEASAFLARFGSCIATKGLQFIIGVDGCRDQSQIERCYNPANAVTREFLMNGLDQANKVLSQSVFSKQDWTCFGFYDTMDQSWKSYYVARSDLILRSAESTIKIGKGERILAIRSAKWTQREVEKVSSAGGFRVVKTWKDDDTTYGNVPVEPSVAMRNANHPLL